MASPGWQDHRGQGCWRCIRYQTATIQVPATGTDDQSGTTTATTANTGAAIAPYGVAVVLLAAAGIALFAVRKNTTRR